MKHITCQHCADTYPDFDVAHVCSRGPYAPKLNENIKTGADIHAGDGGYSIGTEEKYNEFAKGRNQSMGKMRIKELEKQCWSHRVDGVLVDGHLHFNTQKFAELIVEECATVIEKNLFQGIGWNTAKKVKQHFGFYKEE